MTLTQHTALAALAAPIALSLAGPLPAALFVLASVLIDVDHYLMFVLRTGRYSPPAMFRWYDRIGDQLRTVPGFYFGACPCHTVEFFLLLALLGRVWPPAQALFAGCLFHLACDTVYQWRVGALGHRSWSLLYDLLRGRRPHLGVMGDVA